MQNPGTVRCTSIRVMYQKYWKLLWSLTITGLCAAWMLLSTGHITIKAADTTQTVVSLPTITGEPGAQIDAALHIEPNGNQVFSMDITLTYEPAVVSVVSINKAAGLSAWSILSNTSSPGTIRLSGAGSESLSSASDVVNIIFTAVGSAGMSTDLTLTTVNLNEPALPVTIQHGQVSINADTPTPDTPTPDTPTPDTPTPDTPTPDTPTPDTPTPDTPTPDTPTPDTPTPDTPTPDTPTPDTPTPGIERGENIYLPLILK